MTKQSKRLTARPVSEACIRPCFGLQAALFVTVMTGNHCANNQKDPYVSTAHLPVELTYIVCAVTTILFSKKLDRELKRSLCEHRSHTCRIDLYSLCCYSQGHVDPHHHGARSASRASL